MERSVKELIEALSGNDGMARKRARETLVLIGEPVAEHVRSLLGSPEKRVRWEAAKTLAAMVYPPSVEALAQLLGDPLPEIRWLAGDGLINLGPRSVGPVLRSLLGGAPSSGHLEAAHRVLGRLSADNEVLAGVVGPVVEVLATDSPDSGVVATKAGRALSDLDRITGRLPAL